MSKKDGAKKNEKEKEIGVFVRLKGTYYAKTVTYCLPREYEIELQLTNDPTAKLPNEKRIHYICFRKLLPHYFEKNREKYMEYAGVRTCRLVDVRVAGSEGMSVIDSVAAKPISKMNMDDLIEFAAMQDLFVRPREYTTISEARQAVADEIENRRIARQDVEAKEIEVAKKEAKEFEDVEDILAFNNIEV